MAKAWKLIMMHEYMIGNNVIDYVESAIIDEMLQ